MEKTLHEINLTISSSCPAQQNQIVHHQQQQQQQYHIRSQPQLQQQQPQVIVSPVITTSSTAASSRASAGRASFSGSPLAEIHHCRNNNTPGSSGAGAGESDANSASLDNAVLDSWHTSTTESVLQWPHFDTLFPSLRDEYMSSFELEKTRPSLKMRTRTAMYPYVTAEEVELVLEAFQHNVNFWYPTMSVGQLERTRGIIVEGKGVDEDSTETCLALLTMALGCASLVVSGLWRGGDGDVDGEERRRRSAARRAMGNTYLESALKKLWVAHTDVSAEATHCLFFVG